MTVQVLTSVNAGILADGSSDERVGAVLWTGALYRTTERAMQAHCFRDRVSGGILRRKRGRPAKRRARGVTEDRWASWQGFTDR